MPQFDNISFESNPATALESLPVKAEERGTFTPAKCRSSCVRQTAIGGVQFCLAITPAHDLATWQICDGTRLIGATRLSDSRRAKRKNRSRFHCIRDLERELLKNAGIGKAPMFPSLAGKDTGGKHGLSGRFAAIMEKAGIEGKRTQGQRRANVIEPQFSQPCDTRFNSAMANAGISQEVRQKLTGHTAAETNKIYTHHELEPLRAAVSVIPSIGSKL